MLNECKRQFKISKWELSYEREREIANKNFPMFSTSPSTIHQNKRLLQLQQQPSTKASRFLRARLF